MRVEETRALAMLSDGAKRALIRHTREDGPLYDHVLGEDDAEELWFCSMMHQVAFGDRIVKRQPVEGVGTPVFRVYLTPLGRDLAASLRSKAKEEE